jgi:flagellar export protein FliJ
MSPFVFRLDRFLKLRKHAEQERAEALGAAVHAEEKSKAYAEAKAERLNVVADCIASEMGTVATAGALRNLNLVLGAAIEQAEAAKGEHEERQRETEQERERWGKARVERRVIERLRTRRLDAWAHGAARAEQKEMDETASRIRTATGWGT